MVDWLTDWLPDWLADWLTIRLTQTVTISDWLAGLPAASLQMPEDCLINISVYQRISNMIWTMLYPSSSSFAKVFNTSPIKTCKVFNGMLGYSIHQWHCSAPDLHLGLQSPNVDCLCATTQPELRQVASNSQVNTHKKQSVIIVMFCV